MKNDRESRKFFFYTFQYVEAQGGRNEDSVSITGTLFRFEFVSTMRCSDRNSQTVASGFGNEIYYFFGFGVGMMFCRNFIFDTGQYTEFSFYGYIELMSIFYYFLSKCYIFVVRKVRSVDHYRRESHIDTGFA